MAILLALRGSSRPSGLSLDVIVRERTSAPHRDRKHPTDPATWQFRPYAPPGNSLVSHSYRRIRGPARTLPEWEPAGGADLLTPSPPGPRKVVAAKVGRRLAAMIPVSVMGADQTLRRSAVSYHVGPDRSEVESC